MYIEDKIFGPLTFRQFLCVALGAGAYYFFIEPYMAGNARYLSLFIVSVAVIIGLVRFKPKKVPLEHIDVYFKNMRIQLGEDTFKRFIQKRVAEVSSQIYMRKEKGFPSDPKLEEMLLILQKAVNTPSKNE